MKELVESVGNDLTIFRPYMLPVILPEKVPFPSTIQLWSGIVMILSLPKSLKMAILRSRKPKKNPERINKGIGCPKGTETILVSQEIRLDSLTLGPAVPYETKWSRSISGIILRNCSMKSYELFWIRLNSYFLSIHIVDHFELSTRLP